MRLIIFLLKCVVGLLASVGLLIVAAGLALFFLADGAEPWKARQPEIAERNVLSLDLSAGIAEVRPNNPFARFSMGPTLTMRELIEVLEAAGRDDRVSGLVARLGIGDLGIAQIQELREAIADFRAQGKFAVAFAESFGEGGNGTLHYYLASAFEEVWMQPSGAFQVTGLAVESLFLRGALDKLGIVPRLAQREEYKGLMNTFTDRSLPPAQRRNLQRLLDSWFGQITRDIAADRSVEEGEVRAAIDAAPQAAHAALDRGLVDQLGYWDQVSGAVLERAGDGAEFLPLQSYAQVYEALPTPGPTVALIYGIGPVVLARDRNDPSFGETVIGSDTVSEAIAEAVEDPDIEAIVLRIDSPGGSYVASDAIWREVQLAREAEKPLIVSMSNLAASGGYFVAMPAHKIVAQPGTITGSIGVVSGKLVLTGLWDKLGISWDGTQAGEAARFWSMNRDFTPEEWTRLQASLDRVYKDFTEKVVAGRPISAEQVGEVAGGRIWTGEDAREVGLVDELGGLKRALALAAEAAGAPGERAKVKILPEPRDPFKALMEDILSGQVEAMRLRALVAELGRLATVFRPLLNALEGADGSLRDPLLPAPDLGNGSARP